jgi:GNAT superfamily N-acetyltransferase
MMVELAPDDFLTVLPLYQSSELRFPLIAAVVRRRQRGQVFADHQRQPRSALIVNDFGFMFYVGGHGDSEFDQSLGELFTSGSAIKPSYLLWYAPPQSWRQQLNALAPEVRVRERIRFEFRGDRSSYLNEDLVCPPGFEIRTLENELIAKTRKLGVDIDSRFYSSSEDLEKNGLSLCIVNDGEVVSLCYAAAISEGLAEVDVVTDEAFRARGLAQLVSRAFVRECLRREITPTWDCFAYNTSSIRLATKLGFREVARYPFYSFNIPLGLSYRAGIMETKTDGL